MKKLLVMLLCAGALWACTNAEQSKEPVVKAAETSHEHESAATGLTLNNGKKWNSDEPTNRNVADLKAIVARFDAKSNKAVGDYTAFASEFGTGLDKMIKECRMQGPDHEALHQWLEPLLAKTADLKKATTEAEAATLFHGIHERLNEYNTYFE